MLRATYTVDHDYGERGAPTSKHALKRWATRRRRLAPADRYASLHPLEIQAASPHFGRSHRSADEEQPAWQREVNAQSSFCVWSSQLCIDDPEEVAQENLWHEEQQPNHSHTPALHACRADRMQAASNEHDFSLRARIPHLDLVAYLRPGPVHGRP